MDGLSTKQAGGNDEGNAPAEKEAGLEEVQGSGDAAPCGNCQ
jgi:hypothetical protein